MLELAREGKLLGYAMVTLTEAHEGKKIRMTELASALHDEDKHHLLGGIRRMEMNFMKRSWPEDADAAS
jgi:hypothetical protein